MRVSHLVVAALLGACAAPPVRPTPPRTPPVATCDATPAAHRDVIEERVAAKRGTMGRAHRSMVVTSHPIATRIGRAILAKGGNAVDAFVAVVLTQDLVLPGVTSTAGVAGFLVHLAGQPPTYVHGPYRTPPRDRAPHRPTDPPGREVLLPGAPFALLEAQARDGKLPLAEVLRPVEELAREGFEIDALFARAIERRAAILRATPYGARTFFRDGKPLAAGERLRAPELADTLHRVAQSGAREFATGQWARDFVATVRAAGGVVEPADLAGLHATFAEPARASYRGRTLLASSDTSFGGRKLLLTLAILEHAAPSQLGPIETNPAALGLWVRTHRAVEAEPWLFDASLEGELLRHRIVERAEALWPLVRDGGAAPAGVAAPGHHSSAAVVVDENGGTVVGTHTIESLNWARGLFVGGIPLGAARASAPRHGEAPGEPLPDPLSALLVEEEGATRLALTVYGTGLHPADAQLVSGVLDLGRDPETAVLAPRLGWFRFDLATLTIDKQRNELDPRVGPEVRCALGVLGQTLVQKEPPGYPPGRLDLGFPTLVEVRGRGAARELLGMSPEWMDGVAQGD